MIFHLSLCSKIITTNSAQKGIYTFLQYVELGFSGKAEKNWRPLQSAKQKIWSVSDLSFGRRRGKSTKMYHLKQFLEERWDRMEKFGVK